MNFDQTDPRPLATAPLPRGGLPADPTYCEWGAVIGGRIRRARRQRAWTLQTLGLGLRRPDGKHYSAGFVSRLERGRTSAPFYVYIAIADALEIDPGVLLGPDAATLGISEAEATLVRCVRESGIEPHQAILRLLGDSHPDQQLAAIHDHRVAAVE